MTREDRFSMGVTKSCHNDSRQRSYTMKRFSSPLMVAAFGLAITCVLGSSAFAQSVESTYNGHRIIIPQSSIPVSGRHHTNYFYVDSDQPSPSGPPPGVETPGSLAC